MTIELSALSLPQLYDLQKQVVAEIPKRQAAERDQAVEDLKRLAAERGFDLKELLGVGAAKKGPKAGQVVAAKYRSKDGADTWSGRGRKPFWVVAHLAQGGSLEELAI